MIHTFIINWRKKPMTYETLKKKILDALPEDTTIYIETPDGCQDLSTIIVEYNDEGITRLVLSTKKEY